MQVFRVTEGSKFPDWELNEAEKIITIEGIEIDLESSVKDTKTIINITRNKSGDCEIGLGGKAGYVADIELPPRVYRYEEEEGTGEGEETKTTKIPVPINVATVVLRIWPVEEKEED